MSARPPDQLRSPRFLALARRYAQRQLARSLDGFYVEGVERGRTAAQGKPIILAANHVGWWDSFLVVALDEAFGTEGYALMRAQTIRQLPFFAYLGAIPLDLAHPRAGLRAAAAMLDRPGRAVWIFPQGRHRPAHLRPLGFQPGIRTFARLAPDAAILPVALEYAFGEGRYPAAYAVVGEPLPAAELLRDGGMERLERAVEDGLERIDGALAGCQAPLPALVPSGSSRPNSGFGAWMLNRLLRATGRNHG